MGVTDEQVTRISATSPRYSHHHEARLSVLGMTVWGNVELENIHLQAKGNSDPLRWLRYQNEPSATPSPRGRLFHPVLPSGLPPCYHPHSRVITTLPVLSPPPPAPHPPVSSRVSIGRLRAAVITQTRTEATSWDNMTCTKEARNVLEEDMRKTDEFSHREV